ncbi:MAG: HEPN domain-containing protein, partial [Calditrichaeota bacterium]
MKLITREWLIFAQKDVASCERLLGDEFLTNVVAFHAQQAVEKCLKALVEEFEVGFIKTHDLIKLYGSVASYLDFELDLDMLKKLNEVYVDARYPGEFG